MQYQCTDLYPRIDERSAKHRKFIVAMINIQLHIEIDQFFVCLFFNLYHSLGYFSRLQIDVIFSYFPLKTEPIGDTLHEMSNPVFWGEKSKCRLLKVLPRVSQVRSVPICHFCRMLNVKADVYKQKATFFVNYLFLLKLQMRHPFHDRPDVAWAVTEGMVFETHCYLRTSKPL